MMMIVVRAPGQNKQTERGRGRERAGGRGERESARARKGEGGRERLSTLSLFPSVFHNLSFLMTHHKLRPDARFFQHLTHTRLGDVLLVVHEPPGQLPEVRQLGRHAFRLADDQHLPERV